MGQAETRVRGHVFSEAIVGGKIKAGGHTGTEIFEGRNPFEALLLGRGTEEHFGAANDDTETIGTREKRRRAVSTGGSRERGEDGKPLCVILGRPTGRRKNRLACGGRSCRRQ
jgi:hypothetical protein